MDRSRIKRAEIAPGDMLLAFIAASDHAPRTGSQKQRIEAQWQIALGLIDRSILESDKADPKDLDRLALKAIRKS